MARVRVVFTPGWEKRILAEADRMVGRVARRVATRAVSNIVRGGHVKTGALLGSVHTRRFRVAWYRVYIGTDHWPYIEYGTRPHIITPRGRGPLVFQGRRGIVVTRFVRHPGNREYAVMRRALR